MASCTSLTVARTPSDRSDSGLEGVFLPEPGFCAKSAEKSVFVRAHSDVRRQNWVSLLVDEVTAL